LHRTDTRFAIECALPGPAITYCKHSNSRQEEADVVQFLRAHLRKFALEGILYPGKGGSGPNPSELARHQESTF
ncbi:MAG: hypothetical protein DMG87_09850, partial [Acidobacteria bacterium]